MSGLAPGRGGRPRRRRGRGGCRPFARPGWTAREGWWAVTKDPNCWGSRCLEPTEWWLPSVRWISCPRRLPSYLREGIPYLRPGGLRRRVRTAYRLAAPRVIAATGPWRQLPQRATDHYLEPDRERDPLFPARTADRGAGAGTTSGRGVSGHRRSCGRRGGSEPVGDQGIGAAHPDRPLGGPSLADGTANPDGMHWSWRTHSLIGQAVADGNSGPPVGCNGLASVVITAPVSLVVP